MTEFGFVIKRTDGTYLTETGDWLDGLLNARIFDNYDRAEYFCTKYDEQIVKVKISEEENDLEKTLK